MIRLVRKASLYRTSLLLGSNIFADDYGRGKAIEFRFSPKTPRLDLAHAGLPVF